jgi:DNA polymerase-3 subunit beta
MTYSAVLENETTTAEGVSPSIEFTIDRALFLKALGHVQSVVEKRNTIPILSNVKLEAFEGGVSLTTTDMDIAITEKIAADVYEEGALTVPAHTLYEIIRKLPDGSQIVLQGNAATDGKLKISSGSCNFSLSCLPITDFPVMDSGDMSHKFTLTSAELVALIDKTKFAISTEETRYYLNGIFLHAKSDTLCSVATDGHRLAKIEIDLPEGAAGIPGVIVPRKTVAELTKLIADGEADIEVSVSSSKICFICKDAVLLSKLIDGTFPDYDKVIPSGNDKVMSINAAALAKAVDRVSTISFDKTKAIKLAVTSGKLTLSAANEENGTACEEIEVSYSSSPVEVGFNSRYILDMMSGIEGETVEFIFADGAAPVLVKDNADATSLYVIMPMRI